MSPNVSKGGKFKSGFSQKKAPTEVAKTALKVEREGTPKVFKSKIVRAPDVAALKSFPRYP